MTVKCHVLLSHSTQHRIKRNQAYKVIREKPEQGRMVVTGELRHVTEPQVQGPQFCFHHWGIRTLFWRYTLTRTSGPQSSGMPGQCAGGTCQWWCDWYQLPQFKSSLPIQPSAKQYNALPLTPHLPSALSHADEENSVLKITGLAGGTQQSPRTHHLLLQTHCLSSMLSAWAAQPCRLQGGLDPHCGFRL